MPPLNNFYSEISLFLIQHWWLSTAFIVVAGVWLGLELRYTFNGIPRLTASAAVLLINRKNPIILDVRDFAHFDKNHILNALNIPIVDLPQGNGKLDQNKDRDILLVCEQGAQSGKAAQILLKQGLKNLSILQGGIQAWMKEGMPVVKGTK